MTGIWFALLFNYQMLLVLTWIRPQAPCGARIMQIAIEGFNRFARGIRIAVNGSCKLLQQRTGDIL